METVDLSTFMEETKSAETIAYDHALELAYLAAEEMQRQGIKKKELAERMGVTPQRLSNMLNTQSNMTLKSIAQFELALGIRIEFNAAPSFTAEIPYRYESRMPGVDGWGEDRPRQNNVAEKCESAQHLTLMEGGLAA